jgi:hypothetical protein
MEAVLGPPFAPKLALLKPIPSTYQIWAIMGDLTDTFTRCYSGSRCSLYRQLLLVGQEAISNFVGS